MGWNPKKTAPKTGEPIIISRWLWREREGRLVNWVVRVKWTTITHPDGKKRKGWWCEENEAEVTATDWYWMPLPPKESSKTRRVTPPPS